jgi:DNA-binding transcriptional ArsR family regulator
VAVMSAVDDEVDHLSSLSALAHPVRLHLLDIVSDRNISPAEFARERGEPVSKVSYHFRALEKCGCIEIAEAKPVRGSTEHFYRSVGDGYHDDESWARMPDEVRRALASIVLKFVAGRMSRAIHAGTLTARDDVHVTWKPVTLDEQGWKEVMQILNTAFTEVDEAEARAAKRLAKSDEDGLVATVAITGFESPREGQA